MYMKVNEPDSSITQYPWRIVPVGPMWRDVVFGEGVSFKLRGFGTFAVLGYLIVMAEGGCIVLVLTKYHYCITQ